MLDALTIEALANAVVVLLIGVVGVALTRGRNLLAMAVLSGAYSLLFTLFYTLADAVDVAFTEAAVGAVVGTLPLILTLRCVGHTELNIKTIQWPTLLAVLIVAASLFWVVQDMPAFADAAAPIHQHVAPRYINQSFDEVGPPNIVTSVLASYRGYDTLGETGVVFAAATVTLALLSFLPGSATALRSQASGPIGRDLLRSLFGVVLIFGLYVQWHGDYGPGGGFQAGVIFASGIIAYGLIYGSEAAARVVTPQAAQKMIAVGWLLYLGTGVAAMLLGGEFLNYSALASTPLSGQHIGILSIELGVGIAVASAMTSIYFAFAGAASQARDSS